MKFDPHRVGQGRAGRAETGADQNEEQAQPRAKTVQHDRGSIYVSIAR